jgi:hypothetical protein
MDLRKSKHAKREKEFIIGWFGVFGGLLIFFAGLVSRHILRLAKHRKNTFSGGSFFETWDVFAAASADLPSFVMAIGRVIYFVSAVASLFTYEGTQMWSWSFMATGMLLLVGSGMGSMLQENTAFLSLALIGAGAFLSILGLILVDVVPKSAIAKLLLALAVLTGSASFPVGVLAEMKGYSFFICALVESLAAVFGFLGVVIYFRQRIRAASQRYDD